MHHLLKAKKEYKTSTNRRLRLIHQNELDKVCFQHGRAYWDSEHLARRAVSDKVLHDKAFNLAKTPQYDRYWHWLALMVYNFFGKKSSDGAVKSGIMPN